MFRKPSLFALLLVCAALLLVACGSEPEPTPSPQQAVATAETAVAETAAAHALSSTAWQLDNLGSPDEPVALLPDTTATVTYFWDRYAGYDGCNWFLGVYQADAEGNLRMQTPSRTLDVCEPIELQQQAATVVSALLNIVSYTMQGEQLVENTSDNQPLLTFSPATPVPVPGTTWDLKFWWDNDIALWTPLIPESTINILFADSSEATGFGGCNDYSVAFEGDLQIEKVLEATDTYAELPSLTFGAVTSEMAACATPEGAADQEQAYFAGLPRVAYYFKVGGLLLMLDAEGIPLLAFAPTTGSGQ